MASEHHKPFFLFRPRFVMFCLYIAAYAWLRSTNEIAMQSVPLSSGRGMEYFRVIGASLEIPHWRQQLWRAVFSLPMVVEEEGRKHEGTIRRLYDEARGTASQGGQMVRDAAGYVHDNIPQGQQQQYPPQYRPPQQQQYQQQQYQPQYQQQYAPPQQQRQMQPPQQRPQYSQQQYSSQPQGGPALNEGERLIYMPTPQEQQQQNFRSAR